MSTEEAIAEVINGKKQHFEQLVSDHNELLYRIGMSYINNHTEVEDLMQSTYLKAYEKLHDFRHQALFSTWISRIMINECLMYIRSKKRKAEFSLDENENIKAVPVEENTIEKNLHFKEVKKMAEGMILKLPEDYRLVFMLRVLQQLGTGEVAAILNISEENVKVRMFRARRMLQKKLLKEINETDVFSYDKKYCAVLTRKIMTKINAMKL